MSPIHYPEDSEPSTWYSVQGSWSGPMFPWILFYTDTSSSSNIFMETASPSDPSQKPEPPNASLYLGASSYLLTPSPSSFQLFDNPSWWLVNTYPNGLMVSKCQPFCVHKLQIPEYLCSVAFTLPGEEIQNTLLLSEICNVFPHNVHLSIYSFIAEV